MLIVFRSTSVMICVDVDGLTMTVPSEPDRDAACTAPSMTEIKSAAPNRSKKCLST